MTRTPPPTATDSPDDQHHRRRRVAAGIMLGCLLALLVLPWSVGATATSPAVAQANNTTTPGLNETAPYYENQTAVGNQTGWVPANVTLDSIGGLATRFGPFIIGTGETIPGGNTYAGTLVLGLAMTGVFVGAVMYTSVGMAGGVVVATVGGYGLVSAGLAPRWLRVVLVIILGTVAAIAVLRTTR